MTDKRTKQELADALAKAAENAGSADAAAYNALKELDVVKRTLTASETAASALRGRIETAKTAIAAYAAVKHPGRVVHGYDPDGGIKADAPPEDFLLAKFLFNTLS